MIDEDKNVGLVQNNERTDEQKVLLPLKNNPPFNVKQSAEHERESTLVSAYNINNE